MPRLLATQSHVVHGYVGNKAATFPLQCLGWDVDCCNSVQFSNHTGYGMDKVFGNITEEHDLNQLLCGVLANFPHEYDALLSGYLPNKNAVRCVGTHYMEYKKKNPNSLWLMDPVMGDEGQLYVNEDVIPEYKKLALCPTCPINIITPNQFELEILHGDKIDSPQQLKDAILQLHSTIPVIVVTSCDYKMFNDPDHLYIVTSMRGEKPVLLRVPLIKSYFTGVGDLFAALLLDRTNKLFSSSDPQIHLEDHVNDVLNVIQNVLKKTLSYSVKFKGAVMGSASDMKDMELRIIESRDLYNGDGVGSASNSNFIYRKL